MKAMSKWKADIILIHSCPTAVVVNEKGHLICEARSVEDSRLLASAPDLLAAAKIVVENTHWKVEHIMCEGIEKLEKAISRAEGSK